MKIGKTHLVIPDTQAKAGVPDDHLRWIGKYIVDRKPDVVIHLGDHWDMPSLSSYDRGKKQFEGRRYKLDVKAGNEALKLLTDPLDEYNASVDIGKQYHPRLVLLRGNHCARIQIALESDPYLEGVIGYHDLESPNWEVHDFLRVVEIDGISYSHYFYNPMNGRPLGGMVATRLKTVGTSFTMGHQQTLDYAIRFVSGKSQHGLVCGACLTPDHKVLTADLRYVPLGDVKVGDKLVSFDENVTNSAGRSRRFKTGNVLATKRDTDEVFEVTLSNNKSFKVTSDHLWLVKTGSMYIWKTTEQLRKGTRVSKPLEYWDTLDTYQAGYLSGMFDGEGCYYKRRTTTGVIGQLGLSQKAGSVLDKTIASLNDICGIDCTTHTNQRGVTTIRLRKGLCNIAKLLGQIRPVRLLDKFEPEDLGRLTTTDSSNPSVVSVHSIGEREIVRIDVDAKTMIVEGYAHHNCYLHDEEYKGPQGNAHWRGVIVKHAVNEGQYNPMFVDLDYLCRRYEGISLDKYIDTYLIRPNEPYTPWKRKSEKKLNRLSTAEIKELGDMFEEDL